MPVTHPEIPEGWNKYRKRCRLCGEDLEAGAGPLRRQKGHASVKGYWIVEHPGCPGILPWRRHRDGWVYVCTGVGPSGALIKVGTTADNPSDRVTELVAASSAYFPYPKRLHAIMVWGVYEALDRYKAERQVHNALAAHLAPSEFNLGKEVFAAPLPLVLKVLEQVVGGTIELFAWNFENIGRTFTYGYPVQKRDTGLWLRASGTSDRKRTE